MSGSVHVVILAAGLGTRMRSKKAKVLHRAGGLTLVEHVVRVALEVAPPGQVTVVTGHQADIVEQVLAPYGVRFARQTEQRGTGHAVMCCRDAVAGAGPEDLLVILYGDSPLLSAATVRRLVERQQASQDAGIVITTTLDDPTGYGRVLRDSAGHIQAIVEQKACTPEQAAVREINSGIYAFRNALVWRHIGEIGTNNPAGEYYLTDIVEILRAQGHAFSILHLDDAAEVMGINTRVELALVDRIFRERKATELMLAGVTIVKPGPSSLRRCAVSCGEATAPSSPALFASRARAVT